MMINSVGDFNRLWRVANRPTMTAIGAISTWTLPAGYSYSVRADRVVNSNGVPVELDASWYADVSTDINFIPTRLSDQTTAMIATGTLPTGSREVYVLASDIDTVSDAWALVIDNERYHLRQKDGIPGGAAQIYRLRLAHE